MAERNKTASSAAPNRRYKAVRAARKRTKKARAQARARYAQVSEAARRAVESRRDAVAPPSTSPHYPHLSLVRAPAVPMSSDVMGGQIRVATYNVHRWTGLNGRRAPDPARAGFVISELEADVIALQEVLRPSSGDDPLEALCEALHLHLAFAVTREHKRGQLGNAILSRFPIAGLSVIDISFSRIERRGALAAQFSPEVANLGVVATHLSLVDRTRQRQVKSLLEHPHLCSGPAVLLGDMNAWRKCKATRALDETLRAHHNLDWPSSFPAAAPVFALDRVYARGAKVLGMRVHDTPSARRASDHLPVIADLELPDLV